MKRQINADTKQERQAKQIKIGRSRIEKSGQGQEFSWLRDMPSPSRFKAAMNHIIMDVVFAHDKKAICDYLTREYFFINRVMYFIQKNHRESCKRLFRLLSITPVNFETAMRSGDFAGTQNVSVQANLMMYRFICCNGRFFQTSDELDNLLQNTDANSKCPVEYFKLPYPNMYIECGTSRQSPYRIYSPESGNHIFEGAYIHEVPHCPSEQDILNKEHQDVIDKYGSVFKNLSRTFEILLIGSPQGKKNFMDDNFFFLTISISDESQTIEDLLEQHIQKFKDDNPYLTKVEQENIINCVSHVAKIITYINTCSKELAEQNEKTELRQKIKSTIIKSKKNKLTQKQEIAFNGKIVLDLKRDEAPSSNTISSIPSRNIKPHWRRGHFRLLAPSPPLRTEPKPVWVRPALINASQVDATHKTIQSKEYFVKG